MTLDRVRVARFTAIASFGLILAVPPAVAAQSTPAAGDPCVEAAHATSASGTPDAGMGGMAGMDMGSPMAGIDMDGMDHSAMGLDQMYIDMMIPHHASIVAMAGAALPRLEDARLRDLAEGIVAAQSAEIEELRGYREQFFGDPEPMPMDGPMMAVMDETMPGMGSMEDMAFQMDAVAQVAVICAAADADRAFIDLTIPHHEMAIEASETVVEQAEHREIRTFAERVIADQQREIAELGMIREELYGSATPEAVDSGS
jgi:uncharacterized protein (DUF305 family)